MWVRTKRKRISGWAASMAGMASSQDSLFKRKLARVSGRGLSHVLRNLSPLSDQIQNLLERSFWGPLLGGFVCVSRSSQGESTSSI